MMAVQQQRLENEQKRQLEEAKREEIKKREVAMQKIKEVVQAPINADTDQALVKKMQDAVTKFEEEKTETPAIQIGGTYHKCVTMKRVTQDCIVADNDNNSVAFINAQSLGLLEAKKFDVEGYLTGSIGLKFND